MTAATHNIIAEQGATFAQIFTCRDEAGVLVNLTGFTARMQVRASYDSDAKLLDLTTENSGIVLGGAAGTISVLASAAQMAAFVVPALSVKPPRLVCFYDLELVLGSVVERLLQGSFTVVREVTR